MLMAGLIPQGSADLTVKGQQVLSHPVPPSGVSNLTMPVRRWEATKRRHDNQRHSVRQRILVTLVFKGAQQEQSENRCQHFGCEQPHRLSTSRPMNNTLTAMSQDAKTNFRPNSITTEGVFRACCSLVRRHFRSRRLRDYVTQEGSAPSNQLSGRASSAKRHIGRWVF